MKNVYDIRYEKNLTYILPEKAYVGVEPFAPEIYSRTAVIIYLYYMDTLSEYYKYIGNIPFGIDIYIISSRKEVLDEVEKNICVPQGQKVDYIVKENRGRDVSALVVTSRNIVLQYQYVCFLHDKKEHSAELKDDIFLWIENLWGNQIGSPAYINGILELFENNKNLGIIAPPEPIGDNFKTWYGYGWYKSFDITRTIAEKMRLNTDIRPEKPPITLGTVLWFRGNALKKLFDVGWKYSDFNDENLCDGNYLSYGLERIFAYVAQDAGFDTATSMTVSYAEKQTSYLQYTVNEILHEADAFFPINTINDLKMFKKNRGKVVEFGRNNKNVYLYGAGKMGSFCLAVLRKENILPAGYIVSRDSEISLLEGLPVILLEDLGRIPDAAVIITVYDPEIQKAIADNLECKSCHNYMKFWEWK